MTVISKFSFKEVTYKGEDVIAPEAGEGGTAEQTGASANTSKIDRKEWDEQAEGRTENSSAGNASDARGSQSTGPLSNRAQSVSAKDSGGTLSSLGSDAPTASSTHQMKAKE